MGNPVVPHCSTTPCNSLLLNSLVGALAESVFVGFGTIDSRHELGIAHVVVFGEWEGVEKGNIAVFAGNEAVEALANINFVGAFLGHICLIFGQINE